MHLLVQLILNLFSLFLLEQDLVLVVDFGLCQALVSLVTNICQSLLESNLLRIVELLQVGELLLGSHINLVDGVLQLLLPLLELVLELLDLLLETLLGRFNVLLVLSVLLLAESQILILFFFGLGESLAEAFNFLLEVLDAERQLELSLG